MNERITRQEISDYKREILEQTVLVSLRETATILNVHPATVVRRVDEGKLTPYRDNSTGKNLRFLASELRDYVRSMQDKNRNI